MQSVLFSIFLHSNKFIFQSFATLCNEKKFKVITKNRKSCFGSSPTFPLKIHSIHFQSKRHNHIIVITKITIMSKDKTGEGWIFSRLLSNLQKKNRSKFKIKILNFSRLAMKITDEFLFYLPHFLYYLRKHFLFFPSHIRSIIFFRLYFLL